jgi:hypothetical protein
MLGLGFSTPTRIDRLDGLYWLMQREIAMNRGGGIGIIGVILIVLVILWLVGAIKL